MNTSHIVANIQSIIPVVTAVGALLTTVLTLGGSLLELWKSDAEKLKECEEWNKDPSGPSPASSQTPTGVTPDGQKTASPPDSAPPPVITARLHIDNRALILPR